MDKKKLLTPLFLAATFMLASCSTSTIVSRPDWSDSSIIVDNIGLKDNKMKNIYDAIKALGDTNANVLKKIIYEISVKNLGSYSELEKYSNCDINNEDFKKFVNEHKAYQPKDNVGFTRAEGASKSTQVSLEEKDMLKISQALIANQLKQVKLDILDKLVTDLKGGDFVKDNLFSEKAFIMNLRDNMYDIPHYSKIGVETNEDVRIEIKPHADDLSAMETYVRKYLHLDTTFKPAGSQDNQYIYADYVNRKILPDLYHNYLIQNYIKEQRYSNLGRSYARKVNMITIPAAKGSDLRFQVGALLENYSKTIATGTYDFSILEDALRGEVGTTLGTGAHALLEAADFKPIKVKITNTETEVNLEWPLITRDKSSQKDIDEKSPVTKTHVYKGTKLGDLVEKYMKIYDITVDKESGQTAVTTKKQISSELTTAYNDLTNSGAYSIDHGLTLKERELLLTTYTKSGWYLKNGGLSDLNATIRDRLFNIQVANIVDNNGKKDFDPTDYVKYYGNRAFITTTSFKQGRDEDYRMIIDTDDNNFSIIEVEEAVSTSKLSADAKSEYSYRYIKADTSDATKSVIEQSNIVHEVVKATAASGDTYKKNATQYYLLISNIVFSDQSVYDYFKSQYPDLFK